MINKLSERIRSGQPCGCNNCTGSLADEVAALEQRAEDLEGEGHSMGCDVRKDSATSPECSCGWTKRISNIAPAEEEE